MAISQAPSLPDTTATLLVNDRTVGTGKGTAVMGDPAAAVAWLADALAQFATGIEAGEFVMPGSYTTAAFVVAATQRRPRSAVQAPSMSVFSS